MCYVVKVLWWPSGTLVPHDIIYDVMICWQLHMISWFYDIICLWYQISSFGDLWFHNYDIIDWHVWFHSHEIIIWFQGIITSYMISSVWISVLISWFFINEIISWFHVIMSWFDFNALHPVWCHSFDVIIWCHRLCIWFQCITSCMMS